VKDSLCGRASGEEVRYLAACLGGARGAGDEFAPLVISDNGCRLVGGRLPRYRSAIGAIGVAVVNSVMMNKDGKCRCYADGMLPLPCVRYPTFSFVSSSHCLHTVFVEIRERALAGTSRRRGVIELARSNEQQMSGWPVTEAGRWECNCSVKDDPELRRAKQRLQSNS
jgi:hypothetical protein